jgi:hypothetical protein
VIESRLRFQITFKPVSLLVPGEEMHFFRL